MKLLPCKHTKTPILSVLQHHSHNLEPVVGVVVRAGVRDFQLVINQGCCYTQFRCALQVKFKTTEDMHKVVGGGACDYDRDDFDIESFDDQDA
jgi:hypothetical protein